MPMYGMDGVIRGPAFAFLYQSVRVRDTPYGRYHSIGAISVLVGPILGQCEVFTSPCGNVSAGLRRGG